ncbi:MAG: GntR family transcriptional regulator [Planctomycetaceae bacterium]
MRPAAPPPKRSLAVRELIEERIVDGRFPPGMRLDEVALAQEFGVSRTPIRETLIQLSSSGLVDLRPRRGAIVTDVSPHRLCEMFEVMAELEAMCARLAARRITDDEQAELLAAHAACQRARDSASSDDYFAHNETFHQVIYRAAHNAFLAEQAAQLQRRLRPFRRLQLRIRNRVGRSFTEHQGIVDAIVAGDGDKAAQLLREHVIVQGERYGDLVASIGHMKSAVPARTAKRPARRPARAQKK